MLIIRATPQWFADVEAVKPRALTSLGMVDFYPPQCEWIRAGIAYY